MIVNPRDYGALKYIILITCTFTLARMKAVLAYFVHTTLKLKVVEYAKCRGCLTVCLADQI
jgi:hypothetical protein